MRVPLSWLKEFTPPEGPAERIADALSSLGLVVESSEVVASPFDGVVVARVLETRRHPGADRVQLVDVDAGDGEARQVVCGAFNMRPGDLVPLATLGTVMPNGMEIGRRKVRGEWSNGMLCSATELGVGPEGPSPAIFLFDPASATPGQPAAEAFGFGGDVVFDLEISPNRGDCFGVVGVARELAAGLDLPFSVPVAPHVVAKDVEAASVSVDPNARDLCPRFTGTVVENVEHAVVAPLVRRRLALAGMRPLSAVVDVSNYVMLELGQPNHPYDISRLGGRGLEVRRGRAGERLVTLDGVERELCPDDVVICDAEGTPVGLGGIMGGARAEISATTSTVLLEVANFDPLAIAASGARLGLVS
ncbi:MAG: phenylalanine--tRNA ligase subunit beta, partial [Actinobacteria bacterium]|nr:phenylalanine--tRNA ligase subunit beta [Actinomycetota bacterium]